MCVCGWVRASERARFHRCICIDFECLCVWVSVSYSENEEKLFFRYDFSFSLELKMMYTHQRKEMKSSNNSSSSSSKAKLSVAYYIPKRAHKRTHSHSVAHVHCTQSRTHTPEHFSFHYVRSISVNVERSHSLFLSLMFASYVYARKHARTQAEVCVRFQTQIRSHASMYVCTHTLAHSYTLILLGISLFHSK